MSAAWEGWHLGRSFIGSALEDECPCPKAPCGLVIGGQQDPACAQHALARTIRQAHPPEDCPASTRAKMAAHVREVAPDLDPDGPILGALLDTGAAWLDALASRAADPASLLASIPPDVRASGRLHRPGA